MRGPGDRPGRHPLDPDLGVQAAHLSVTVFDESVLGFEWSADTAQSMSSGAVGIDMSKHEDGNVQYTTPQGLHFAVEGFDGEQMILIISVES